MSFLVNGSPTNEFDVGRGLRQGDPLSPFLFLLATEGFNVMVSKAVQLNLFEGYKFVYEGIKVSYLQYADDTLITGKKSWKNVSVIKLILHFLNCCLV